MYGCMDVWMYVSTDKRYVWMYVCMDVCKYGYMICMDVCMDVRMDL